MTAARVDVTARARGQAGLSPAQLDELNSRIEGSVLSPGTEGWDEAVLVWNAMTARTPAHVVQPLSARDVAATVGFARELGLLLSVKWRRPQHRRHLDRRGRPDH